MKNRRGTLILAIMVLSIVSNIEAKDFGKQASSFPIKEEGFITMIKRKLSGLDLKSIQDQMQLKAKQRLQEPEKVLGIIRASKDRAYIYDPTYTLEEDITLPSGTLLYAKGTKVNPLENMALGSRLIFIDGSDKAQVEWVKERYIGNGNKDSKREEQVIEESSSTTDKLENKLILVAGRPLELEEGLNHKIYFDQAGILTSKFGIQFVPAVVEQEGKNLKIVEICINK